MASAAAGQVPYVNETELMMDVLRHGDQVIVRAPAALARLVRSKLDAAARRYR
jgi:predicted DNA-binding transcriptional regulator YafY